MEHMTWGRVVVLPMELEFVGTIKLFLGPEEPGGPGESREPTASRELGTNREFGDLRTFMVDDSVHNSATQEFHHWDRLPESFEFHLNQVTSITTFKYTTLATACITD